VFGISLMIIQSQQVFIRNSNCRQIPPPHLHTIQHWQDLVRLLRLLECGSGSLFFFCLTDNKIITKIKSLQLPMIIVMMKYIFHNLSLKGHHNAIIITIVTGLILLLVVWYYYGYKVLPKINSCPLMITLL
jgi:hypothetical protein